MTNKNKHSKYRNTGLLFEFMTRQITDDILNEKQSSISNIIYKYFKQDSEIAKEYSLYRTLMDTTSVSETKAKILLDNVLEMSKKINRQKLDRERWNLVKELKETYDIKELFKLKIPNYKLLASINYIIENGYSETDSADHIYYVLDHLTHIKNRQDSTIQEFLNRSSEEREKILNLFIETFNNKFSSLSENQKDLLSEYMKNVSNNKRMVEYIRTSVPSLKSEILKIQEEYTLDDANYYKLNEVISILDNIVTLDKINNNHVSSLLYIYELANTMEIK